MPDFERFTPELASELDGYLDRCKAAGLNVSVVVHEPGHEYRTRVVVGGNPLDYNEYVVICNAVSFLGDHIIDLERCRQQAAACWAGKVVTDSVGRPVAVQYGEPAASH